MADYFEIDFLGVETEKSGDAIALRYSINGQTGIHVVDGGYIETGDQLIDHIKTFYGTTVIDHVVLTHPDRDHANGLRKILETCTVRNLWMNRPWLYASQIIDRFETYQSIDALERKLRSVYDASVKLEEIAIRKNIPIFAPFQGSSIGPFTVLAPSFDRYLDLIVESDKTPQAAELNSLDSTFNSLSRLLKAATQYIKSVWGNEYFPPSPTSRENEMSVVQTALLNDRRILLTGDAGREALQESINYAPQAGLTLPGIDNFQVPHHGGRHNVSTEILDNLLGPRLATRPATYTWNAVCSSAKADEDHPRKSVIRAILHRGGHWAATEGQSIRMGAGITREGWTHIPQADYPEEQEQ
ncbi:hypothetical protein ALFP_0437 [Alcaligenes faecalis]|uniref:ComEC/Rec2 family competence protein n=1 Tax=Alcaligenes faecalis TaxID=511 RepID=UPI0007C50173|nr:hypothetical protein [Alcaligenes faecalis]ARP52324.1 hypothetical protein ALFP_0437 [Alcaligenes faecalis]